MQLITYLVTAYVCIAAACLVMPALLAFFIPSLGGPLVLRVLSFFFLRPSTFVAYLARSLARSPNRGQQPPGWYDDPDGHDRVRWWGGTSWTGFIQVEKASKQQP